MVQDQDQDQDTNLFRLGLKAVVSVIKVRLVKKIDCVSQLCCLKHLYSDNQGHYNITGYNLVSVLLIYVVFLSSANVNIPLIFVAMVLTVQNFVRVIMHLSWNCVVFGLGWCCLVNNIIVLFRGSRYCYLTFFNLPRPATAATATTATATA